MMKGLPYLLLVGFSLLGQQAWGQLEAAEKDYKNRSFQQAIPKYERYIEKNTRDYEALAHLAECFQLTGQTEKAEEIYAVCVKGNKKPSVWLAYAQMAFTNGNHEAAEAAWMKYADLIDNNIHARRARAIAAQCSRLARSDSSYDAYDVEAVHFNSEGMDYSPTYLGDGELVFASDRNKAKGKQGKNEDPWTGGNFMDLYRVTLAEDHVSGIPEILDRQLNSKYHDASASFSADGKSVYFTRSDYNRSKRGYDEDKNTRLKIYRGEQTEGGWKVVESLSFNSSDFSTCHPALSPDGSFIVFSTDRNSQNGKKDLYISYRNGDTWGAPVNLGKEINTPGNEVFPSIAPDGRLIFSSDFHVGFGGLDVFVAQRQKDLWANPENFGSPVNSARDDFGLVLGKDLASGYFSSNRDGQQDDLYYFSGMPSVRIEGVVLDCQTGTLVPGAEVRVMEGQDLITTIFSDEEGNFRLSLPPNKEFVLHAAKDGYFATPICTGKATVSTAKTDSAPVIRVELPLSKGSEIFMRDKCCFTLTKKEDKSYPADRFSYQWVLGDGSSKIGNNIEHCFTRPGSYPVELRILDKGMRKLVATQAYPPLDASGCPDLSHNPPALLGKVYNQRYGTALPDAEVRLTNRCTGEVFVVKSDRNGVYYAPLDKPCDYIVSATKGNFRPFLVTFSTLSDPNNGSFVLDIPLEFDDNSPAPVAGLDPGVQPTVGQTLELYHIYFDLDSYNIRRDAVPDLEQLFQLMMAYPGMAGELSAHTDSRASYEHNAWLSEKRARAARDYLVARGIDPSRITARGFGEMRIKNSCVDDVPCSEEQHQRNRRVEFRVTDMGQTIQSRELDRFAKALSLYNSASTGGSMAGRGDVDLSGALPGGRALPQLARTATPGTPATPLPTWSRPLPSPTPAPGIAGLPTPQDKRDQGKPAQPQSVDDQPTSTTPIPVKSAQPGVPARSNASGSAGKPIGSAGKPWVDQPMVVPYPESRPEGGSTPTTTDAPVVPLVAEALTASNTPDLKAGHLGPLPAPKPTEAPAPAPTIAPAPTPTPATVAATAAKPDSQTIVYKVQVGVFRNPITDAKMAEMKQFGEDVTMQKESTFTRYLIGGTTDMKAAVALSNRLKKSGYPDCFVTAWKDGAMLAMRVE